MAARKVKEAKVVYEAGTKAPFDIRERTFLFGVRAVKLVGRLPRTVAGIEIGRQLIGSGTHQWVQMSRKLTAVSRSGILHTRWA